MSDVPVLAVGVLDADGVWGEAGLGMTWGELEAEAPGTGRTFRKLFGRRDPTFRRIDRLSRAFVLAVEASGIHGRNDLDRENTAVVFETGMGAIDTDIEFAEQLATDVVDGPLFPYSLPSASIGEVALRHGLRGECLCFATDLDGRGTAWREAAVLRESGEYEFVLTGVADVLTVKHRECDPTVFSVAALIGPGGEPLPRDCDDPFRALAARVRGRPPHRS